MQSNWLNEPWLSNSSLKDNHPREYTTVELYLKNRAAMQQFFSSLQSEDDHKLQGAIPNLLYWDKQQYRHYNK